jgi:2-C-methyl-D-erythritol 4-phosphate cytidylyltransferase
MIWYFLVGWVLYKMISSYFKYAKEKIWLHKAKAFIEAQNGNEVDLNVEESEDNKLAEIMAFNEAISKQENEHWSIKIYDAIANIFTRKK